MAEMERVYKSLYAGNEKIQKKMNYTYMYCHRKFELCALWEKYKRKNNAKENGEMRKILMIVGRSVLFRIQCGIW